MSGVAFVQLARQVLEVLDQEHRFAHVVRVARMAGRLAHAHGEDAQRARLAGLLHDLARLWSGQRLLEACAQRQLPVDAFERAHPVVLHAIVSAELAREQFGIDDPAVLSAIRLHTLASPVMSRLDAVVFLADGLEPGRDFAERQALARLAFADLDGAMRAVLRSQIAYVQGRGQSVAPQTLAALARYAGAGYEEDRKTA